MPEVIVFTVFFDMDWPAGYYAMFASAAVIAGNRDGAESRVNEGPRSTRKARFDALKLAVENETLSGVIDARGLDRVADRIAAGRGAVRIAWRMWQ